MNKEMFNYFKGEKEFYEFVLLHMDGKQRAEMLGITLSCYSKKKVRENWFNNIREKIQDERAINKLTDLYEDMN